MPRTIAVTAICAILLPVLALAAGTPAPIFNVRDIGALGDGQHKDTSAHSVRYRVLRRRPAEEPCFFPPGRYLTGGRSLRSHITFDVGPGAVILGSEDPADYPLHESVRAAKRKAFPR